MRKGFNNSLLKRKLNKKVIFEVFLRKLNSYKRYRGWLNNQSKGKGLSKVNAKFKKSNSLRFIKR
jgi:hypothetical protein